MENLEQRFLCFPSVYFHASLWLPPSALKGGNLLRTGLRNMYWLCIACVEQPVLLNIFRGVKSLGASTAMLTCSLFLIVFVMNAYKAMMKCTYTLKHSYSTPLKFLRDLEGFTLFFVFKFPGYGAIELERVRHSNVSSCENQRPTRYPQLYVADSFDCEAKFLHNMLGKHHMLGRRFLRTRKFNLQYDELATSVLVPV